MVDVSGGQDSQLQNAKPIPTPWGLYIQSVVIYGLALWFLIIRVYRARKRRVDLPVLGPSGLLGSWMAVILYKNNARAWMKEGYEKHRNHAFQIPLPSRWEIIVCSEAMIKEYRNVDQKILSASAVTAEFFQAKYTMPGAAEGIHKIPITILAKGLNWQRTRAAAKADNYFSEFYDEMVYGFSKDILVAEEGWTVIPCFPVMANIITHMTLRSLVGRPLCRVPDFLDLSRQYADAVLTSGLFIAIFPEFLKPLAASVCSAPKMAKRLEVIILELISQRRQNTPKVSDDLVDWMMKWVGENAASGYNDHDIAVQIVALSFASISSTTQILAHCVFEIATRKEYIEPLRQEVNQCLNKYGGWNEEAVEAMIKLDSFIKECQRYNPLDAGSLARLAVKDFTFSNGLHIPAGNYLRAPNAAILVDPDNYPDPQRFDGLRYYRLRHEAGQSHNHTFVSASLKNLQFGEGRHVCPGRFMASDGVKSVLAHILINYDVAIKDHGPRPANIMFAKVLLPSIDAEVMLRKIRA